MERNSGEIIHWDLDRSLILDANDEFLRMTGYDRADGEVEAVAGSTRGMTAVRDS